MSKQKNRKGARERGARGSEVKQGKRGASKSPESRSGRRAKALLLVGLLVGCISAGSILASKGGLPGRSGPAGHSRVSGVPASAAVQTPTPTPSPLALSKEYIYAGGTLVAVEEGGGGAGVTPQSCMTITGIQPPSGSQGATGVFLMIQGTGFTGATESMLSFDPTNLTEEAGSFTVVSDTEITMKIDISSSANLGPNGITIKKPNCQASCFLGVTAPNALSIGMVGPDQGTQGTTINGVEIDGRKLLTVDPNSGVVFLDGQGPTANIVPGLTASGISLDSDTVIHCNIQIGGTVPAPVTYYIAVQTTGQNPTRSNTLPFNVILPQTGPPPQINSLSPSTMLVTDSLTLTVNGQNFNSSSVIFIDGQQETTNTSQAASGVLTTPVAGFYATAGGALVAGAHTVVVVNNPFTQSSVQDSNAVVLEVTYPVPVINSVSPTVLAAGATSPVNITVTSNANPPLTVFTGNTNITTVRVNGSDRTTRQGTGGQNVLTVTLLPADLANPGTLTINAFNPAPGGGVSGGQAPTVQVIAAPAITGVSPPSGTAGASSLTLTIAGSNFRSSDVVLANGTAVPSTVASATQITATVPASSIAAGGTLNIQVKDNGAGGGVSNTWPVTINNPIATITNVQPGNVFAGAGNTTIAITGTRFICGQSQVQVNSSSNLAITSCSATQIMAILPSGNLSAVGTVTLTVFNPTPGGGTSNTWGFVVNPPPPNAPTALTATAVSSTQINLEWTDNSNNETAFVISRKAGASGTYAPLATLPPNTPAAPSAVTYEDTGLTPGTTYFYQVLATNSGSDSAPTNEYSATPYPAAPAAPTNLAWIGSVPDTGAGLGIILGWTDTNTNENGIKLERSINGAGFVQIAVLCPGTTTFTDSPGLHQGTLQYQMRSFNSAGDSAYCTPIGFSFSPSQVPAAPSGLTATAQTGLQIVLQWTSNSSIQTGFKVFRQQGNTSGLVATVAANVTNYTDTGLTADTQYCYWVKATNAAGDSAQSNTACATTGFSILTVPRTFASPVSPVIIAMLNGDFPWRVPTATELLYNGASGPFTIGSLLGAPQSVAPGAPLGLAGWPVSGTQVNLSWVAADATQTGFSLERGTSSSGPFTALASLGTCGSVFTYADTGLTAGTIYYYRMRAFNSAGYSAYTRLVSVTPPTAPTISGINPLYVLVGSAGFNLTVNGSGFVNGAVVNIGATSATTTFVSATQLTAAVTPGLVASAGTPAVTVSNPSPAPLSNSVNLNVVANNQPGISGTSPSSTTVGVGSVGLAVNGSNFVSTSAVAINGTSQPTTFVGPAQLTTAIPASLTTGSGNLSITVVNPAPGTTSTATTVTVNNPVPTLSSIAPATVTAGTGSFTLTVTGTSFVAGSQITVNGTGLSTSVTPGSNGLATTATATVPGSNIQSAGSLTITVFNPTPGGGTSGSKTLTINPAIPPTPTGLAGSVLSPTSVKLTWNASTGATGYKVYSVGPNGNLLLATINSGSTTTYTDNSAQSSSVDCYKVSAFAAGGESPLSSQVCVTTP